MKTTNSTLNLAQRLVQILDEEPVDLARAQFLAAEILDRVQDQVCLVITDKDLPVEILTTTNWK